MPTPREIKRRFLSVKNIQKITRAMEMVSSVKLKKARDQILAARPYAQKLAEIAHHLQTKALNSLSPLLISREVKTINLLVVSADKGLCSSFNANIFKKTAVYFREHPGSQVTLTIIGKKACDFFGRRKNYSILKAYNDVFFKPNYTQVSEIGQKLLSDYLAGTIDQVDVIYNEFKSAAVSRTVVEQLLPIKPTETEATSKIATDYLFEPGPQEVLDAILPKYFLYQVWRIVLESYAAEQGARMTAMNAATKNAGELIEKLMLVYNKARQGLITKELLEVVSGAEALK
jgi:F-type H+-transporting ATPase subunit gamma